MTKLAKEVLDKVVAGVTGDSIAQFVRKRLFVDGCDIPCRSWSFLNQFVVAMSGTTDARGLRQWQTVGRKVKRGAKAFYILVPMLVQASTDRRRAQRLAAQNLEDSVPQDREQNDEEARHLVGFRAMPVFRVEDTQGALLTYELKIRAFDPSTLPLYEVAKKMGVTITTAPLSSANGLFRKTKNEIVLGTDDPRTFLHELSHAIDAVIPGKNEQDYALGEVVAELSSCFLGSLYGVAVDIGHTKAYIEHYVGKGHVALKVIEALGRVEAIYGFIKNSSKSEGETNPQGTYEFDFSQSA